MEMTSEYEAQRKKFKRKMQGRGVLWLINSILAGVFA